MKYGFSFFIVPALLLGCSGNKINNELLNDIDGYYFLEKSHDWEAAYAARPQSIRQQFTAKYYVDQMKRDAIGWQLTSWDVEEVKVRDRRKAEVRIHFRERISRRVAESLGLDERQQEFGVDEWTIWVHTNNKWECLDCGQRMHLALNSE